MATITDLDTASTGAESLTIINNNFDNLNNDKLEKSGGTLTGAIVFSGTTHAGIRLNNLTTAQRDALTPSAGMIIYNTTTGQVEKYEDGSWVGATGVANASSTVEGIVELATQSEIDNDTATGGTGAALAITPDQLKLSKYGTGIPSSDEKAALAGTSGTPSSTNKYVTNDDTATAATANKVARRLAGGNITVVTETQANNSTNAASTAYVDTAISNADFLKNAIENTMMFSFLLNDFTEATSGGSVTKTATSTLLNSGGSDTNYAKMTTGADLDASKDFTFICRAKINATTSVGKHRWGIDAGITIIDETGNQVRSCFEINNATLYASSSSGSAKTQTNVSAGITLTNYNIYKIVRVSDNIKYYINGTQVAEHTTNLPTSSANLLQFISMRSGSGGTTGTATILNNAVYKQAY